MMNECRRESDNYIPKIDLKLLEASCSHTLKACAQVRGDVYEDQVDLRALSAARTRANRA